jgi:hypothetical protein
LRASSAMRVDDLDDRRDAVGGARGGGEQTVPVGAVLAVVHAHHDVERAALHGGGDDHLLHAGLEVGVERLGRAELARALQQPSISSASPSPRASRPQRPCTESNISRWAEVAASPFRSLMWANVSSGQPHAARRTSRPIRPKPLIPTRVPIGNASQNIVLAVRLVRAEEQGAEQLARRALTGASFETPPRLHQYESILYSEVGTLSSSNCSRTA